MVLCSLFENPITVNKDNEGEIALAASLQMRSHTKHITIKYNHVQSIVANVNVDIKYVDTKEQIADIFMKALDSELIIYLRYKING